MSYVEGLGDEVVGVMVSFVVVTFIALLWKTTHVSETPSIHSVVITATPISGTSGISNSRIIVSNSTNVQHHSSSADPGAAASDAGTATTTDNSSTEDEQLSIAAAATTAAEGSQPAATAAASEEGEEEEEESSDEPKIRIKLRFLDETTIDVETQLSERLVRFRRKHLESHLNLGPTDKIKLIFNGKIIHRDTQQLSEAGIYDNCVVHCLVQRDQPTSADGGGGAAGGTAATSDGDIFQSELDLQAFCFPLLGTILFGCWWFLLFYSQHFTMLAAMSLVSLTVLYLASVANLMLY